MGQNKWRYSKKTHIWNRVRLYLRGKKIIVNQILFSKLWYRPNLYYSKIYQKRNWKKNIQYPLEQEKMQPLIHLSQLSILRSGLGISDIDTQLNYIYKKWIQRLLTPILTIFEISHAVLIEINSEFGSRPSPF